jgi:cysteine desulfuration protein SufE
MATLAFEEIAEIDFLDDWEDRYRHVIDLGKAMPPLDDAFGCQRLCGRLRQSGSILPQINGWQGPGVHLARVKADAMIVRGLILRSCMRFYSDL